MDLHLRTNFMAVGWQKNFSDPAVFCSKFKVTRHNNWSQISYKSNKCRCRWTDSHIVNNVMWQPQQSSSDDVNSASAARQVLAFPSFYQARHMHQHQHQALTTTCAATTKCLLIDAAQKKTVATITSHPVWLFD